MLSRSELSKQSFPSPSGTYVISGFSFTQLNQVLILKHSAGPVDTLVTGYFDLQPEEITTDLLSFTDANQQIKFPQVTIRLAADNLIFSCRCHADKSKLCDHQSRAFFNLMQREEIRIFLDHDLRQNKLRTFARAYGLENQSLLDDLFTVTYTDKRLVIAPKDKNLISVSKEKNILLQQRLIPQHRSPLNYPDKVVQSSKMILVLKQHRYYHHFQIELMEAATAQNGKLKNPFKTLNPMDYLWATDRVDELKFYTAVSKFQQNYEPDNGDLEISGLRALVKNPMQLQVYCHDPKVSHNINVSTVTEVKFGTSKMDLQLSVDLKKDYYTITGHLLLDSKRYDLGLLNLKYTYFILYEGVLHLIDNADFLKVIDYLRQHNNHLVIHQSKFQIFQDDILAKLENRIQINYSYIKPATPEQLEQSTVEDTWQKLIYLSDSENHIMITPVMKYGLVEVPVLSRKQIYATDQLGVVFLLNRDSDEEYKLISMLVRQHPYFQEQDSTESFYLHKSRFLEDGWFLDAFTEWREQDITVLGFNELKGNQINPHKVKITIAVNSGLNWFDSQFEISFGDQKVALKHLHRSIRNKSKFVTLGDGTMGLLPQEWIDKLSTYFNAGEVQEDSIRIPKVNFSAITELFENEVLSATVQMELSSYQNKISKFKNIADVAVPPGLQGELRDYQKEGLNWLTFLDDFGFGGCLADDMGLGKTIQIIAFILTQRYKAHKNTNLIVVPTTLIFNWQEEIVRFAPDIKVYTIYGNARIKETSVFDDYEVVLTSYGTLLQDIGWLKKYSFNYVFLDESQAIKNPESLRYRAVCLLHSRNRITMTGTPIENNTFDLYGQISFACPGLLGTRQFFRDQYAIPIDKFKDTRSALALKKKVSPFILRRTKKEVATELPEKTEMVIYCEMGTAQKNAYDACKNEYISYLNGEKDDDLTKNSLHILKGLTQLRQICNSPALLGDNLLHSSSSSKIDTLMEEIQSHSPQHKILVFSQFVSMLDLIKTELAQRSIAFEYLTGQTGNRAAKVNNFQKNDEVRVFLISLKAGGTGLNLTEADYVYLVDPWWNPAAENQAIDRCYRIGQKKKVVAIRLICPGTIEEKIMRMQENKKGLAGDLIQTDVHLLKSLTRKDLLGLFS